MSKKIRFRRLRPAHLVAAVVLVIALGGFVWGATQFQPHKDKSSAQASACSGGGCDSNVWIYVNGITPSQSRFYSSPFSFGTCNDPSKANVTPLNPSYFFTFPYPIFGNYIWCQGFQFGPPNGVRLYANTNSLPGYSVNFVRSTNTMVYLNGQYNPSGSVDCSQNTNCRFSFDSGDAFIQANFTAQPPSTPSLSSSGSTTNSISLNWTASTPAQSAQISRYELYRDGNQRYSGLGTSFTDSGLGCGEQHSYYVKVVQTMANTFQQVSSQSSTKSFSTSACQSSSPPPSGGGSSDGGGSGSGGSTSGGSGGGSTSGGGSSSGGSSGGSGGGSTSGGGNSVPSTVNSRPITSGGESSSGGAGGGGNNAPVVPPAPDTTPPSTPAGLLAYSNEGDVGVNLSWQPSTDDIGVVGYKLERSSDGGKNWIVIGKSIPVTFSVDANTKFNTDYRYRLSAFDAAGNYSNYATYDLKTGGFKANVGPKSSVTLTSDDNIVSATVPEGALTRDAICSVELEVNLGEIPDVPEYELAAGPYYVICKHEDSSLVGNFNKPVPVTIDTSLIKGFDALAYYLRNSETTMWDNITEVTLGEDTASFEITDGTTFAVMGKPHRTPWWVALLWIIGILALTLFILVFGYGFYRRRKLQDQYDDYYRKSHGF